MRRIMLNAFFVILIAGMLMGCSSLAEKIGFKSEDELSPVSSIVMNEEEAKKITDKVPIQLYFGEEGNTKLKLEVRYIEMSEAKKSANHLAGVIVNELIKGPAEPGLKAVVPKETKLLGAVALDGGTATINLSKEFVEKHPGGEAASKMTIFSIVNSLTEMKEIQKVRFLIEGKQQPDFKGSYKFDNAFQRTVSLIGKSSIKPSDPKMADPDKNSDERKDSQTEKNSPVTAEPSGKGQENGSSAPAKTPAGVPPVNSPSPSPSGSISQGTENSQSAGAIEEEEAEATYLEVLEEEEP